MKFTLVLSLVFATGVLSAQSKLKLEEIMQGPGFTGYSPENIRWSADSKSVYFDWNHLQNPGNLTYVVNPTSPHPKEATLTIHSVPSAGFGPESTYATYYYESDGTLMRYRNGTSSGSTVLSLEDAVSNVQRVLHPGHVYFVMRQNLYCYDEQNGSVQQITRLLQGTAPTKTDSTLLMKQQYELFDYIRKEAERQKWQTTHSINRKIPEAYYYAKNERPEDLVISPDERFVTFRLSDYGEETPTFFEEFISPTGYTNRMAARPKVGNTDPTHRLAIYDLAKDTVYFVGFSGLSDVRKKPAYLSDYGTGNGLYDRDRALIMHAPVMHPNGKTALVDVRSYDNKDRWIVLLDLATGAITEMEHQHDEAWIGGPGISGWNAENGTLGWIDDSRFYFQSEETGFSHLYLRDIKSGSKTALTSGNWEVHDVVYSKKSACFYLITNTIHPGVRNGYRLRLASGKMEPLFTGNFGIEWTLSPDEKYWAIRYSTATQPWELYLAENKPGAVMKRITHSETKAFSELSLIAPQIVQVPASDGYGVTARLYKPANSNGAAVLFVHGAGYLQNAHYYWSNYQREFLFHQLLLEKGYTILDMDYRASEGYGRDVRTAIYRHMGERDLLDYVDGKRYLVKQFGIDSSRVGIYGGSYGGFITLMGMLKTPGTFACGAALRSVTDWQHYNHEYTSNILNYPGTDPEAYRKSSPIYYASGLNGPLLMLHGMEDDNVQFQDIVRLNQRFIELGKTNYELAVFPTEAHGFQYTPAWTDEYRRILELFERYLR